MNLFTPKLKTPLRLISLFSLVYNFGIYPIPRTIRSGVILTFMLLAYALLTNKVNIRMIPSRLLLLLTSFVFSILVGILLVISSKYTYDFSFIKLLVLTPIFLLGSYLTIVVFYKGENVSTLVSDLVTITIVQSVIILLMVVNPWFSSTIKFLAQNLQMLENGPNLAASGQAFRGNGLSGALFWDFGLQQSIGLIFLVWMLKRYPFKLYYTFGFLLITLSVFMTSRSGLIGIFAALAFLFVFKSAGQATRFPTIKLISTSTLCILSSLLVIDFELFESIYEFAFELFINYSETGELTSSSTDHFVNDMIFLPPLNTILFGDGQYTSADGYSYYAQTDSGYIRHLFYWGSFSLFFYSIYLYMAYYTVQQAKDYLLKFQILSVWIIFFFMHIKGDLFLGSYQCLSIMFLFYFYYLINEHESFDYNTSL